MARWPFRPTRTRATDPAEPEITKAAPTASAAHTFTAEQVAALMQTAQLGPATTGTISPLPRTEPMVAFGPGMPMLPAALDPVDPHTGRPLPRFTEYPVSVNLPGVTDKLVPWKVLRDAAEVGGIPRRCIEIRKSHVAGLEWAIVISKEAIAAAQAAAPNESRSDIEQALRKRLAPEIARCTAFWQKPDPGQDENWGDWVSKLMEEHLVLDAVAIYPRQTRGGGLYSLEILDGSTIKVLRDNRGGKPLPPNPAYQQLLWGFPRGEWIADVDDEDNVINPFIAAVSSNVGATDTLIYKRRNVRSTTPYGFSAVEQCLSDYDVWLQRRAWIRSEYTDGTVPAGFLKMQADTLGWTPDQVHQYEGRLNDMWSGQSGERRRLRILPPGLDMATTQDIAERYKPDYDLFLLRQLASHFGVTLPQLNFSEPGGLGSTGYHEGVADIQDRTSTQPDLRWLQELLTDISRRHLRMSPQLELKILGLEQEDAAAADAVAESQVKWGRLTLNEDRDRLGKPRYPFPEADMPMLMTTRGVVFLEGASQEAPPGETVTPVEAPPNTDANGDGIPDKDEVPTQPPTQETSPAKVSTAKKPAVPSGKPASPGDEDAKDAADEHAGKVKAELAAYRRWARRNPYPARPFQFQTVTKADAPELLQASRAVQFAAPATTGGDGDPKAGSPAWPGWDRDHITANAWVPRILRVLDNAANWNAIAADWIAHTHTTTAPDDGNGTEEWDRVHAEAWLNARGLDLTPALLALVKGLRTEGWAIGHASAHAVIAKTSAVFGWKPGDTTRARNTLPTDTDEHLAAHLNRLDSWARKIAAGRLGVLAGVLAKARRGGMTAKQLAAALRDAIRNAKWALVVALTELMYGQGEGAADTYALEGRTTVQWVTDGGACDLCQTNEDEGPVPLGTVFPDGSTCPPAHANCRCALLPADGGELTTTPV